MKNLNVILNESSEFFKRSEDIVNAVVGDNFKNMIMDPRNAEAYIERLTEDVSASTKASLVPLMKGYVKHLLTESAQISPYASLSLPLLKVLWPYVSLKEGIKTKVAEVDYFVVSYHKYFLYRIKQDGTREERELPAATALLAQEPNGQRLEYALSALANVAQVTTWKLAGTATDATLTGKDQFSRDLKVVGLTVKAGYRLQLKPLDTSDTIYAQAISETTGAVAATLGVKFNLQDKTAIAFLQDAASPNNVLVLTDAKIVATLSPIWNETGWSFTFKIDKFHVSIPEGIHLNYEVPVEWLTSLRALYSIDGVAKGVDAMHTVLGDLFDREFVDFLVEKLALAPSTFKASFNVLPRANYMGDLVEWRSNMLKEQIEKVATKILETTYLKNGHFTIFATPSYARMLHGINWMWQAGAEHDGIIADYSVGTFRGGAHIFKVLSSPRAAFDLSTDSGTQGGFVITFTPTVDDEYTFMYYPLYFGVEETGYRSPNHSNVPAVMVTRRHKFESFINAIGCVIVTEAAEASSGYVTPLV